MYPLAELFLGLSLADQGNLKEAADHLRSYLLLQPNAPNAEAIKKQLAAWEQTTAAGGTTAVGAPRPRRNRAAPELTTLDVPSVTLAQGVSAHKLLKNGGRDRTRTCDLLRVKQAL